MTESDPAPESSPAICRWLRYRTNDVTVALMAVMFVSFLLQIVFRYALDRPLGWTEEITVLCWVWVVLWGESFMIADAEEIRFDIVFNIVPAPLQRIFTVISSLALVLLMGASLPATWQYITFMHREHSAYLKIPFDYLYSIYLLFALVCILRQARVAWKAITSPKTYGNSLHDASGDQFE